MSRPRKAPTGPNLNHGKKSKMKFDLHQINEARVACGLKELSKTPEPVKCLGCGGVFDSEGNWNRMCKGCRRRSREESGDSDYPVMQ